MKQVKNIFFSLALLFTMSYYFGHDVVRYFDHFQIENQSNNAEQQKCITSGNSFEEVIAADFSISINPTQFTREELPPIIFLFPHKIYYSIWLPPDKS